ncbi:oxygen-insensitive NADPH nitroreductase [Dehalogenimonas sp. WBC-2]|nr:oxygen-insensitive NADPH nitroreductase [Dehalogenimonas sp. WBC-2]
MAELNETLRVIGNRRSIRAYSKQPVTGEEKDLILKAAFRSPTAGNLMLYSIIEIEDQQIKDKLAVSCDNQPFIATAPWVLLFLADYQRWFDYFTHCGVEGLAKEQGIPFRKPQSGDLMLACCDALIAAQTAVVAAESLGIGSCYIGDILENYEYHRELFNLPPYTIPITMLCFGHPAKTSARQTSRMNVAAIVHKNKYHRFSGEELGTVYSDTELEFQTRTHAGKYENAGQEIFFRKFAADYATEMNRSVKVMLQNWGQ